MVRVVRKMAYQTYWCYRHAYRSAYRLDRGGRRRIAKYDTTEIARTSP